MENHLALILPFNFSSSFFLERRTIFLQIYSQVSISSYFMMKGCSNIILDVILFSGSFSKAECRKSLELDEPVFIINFSVTIFEIQDFFVILNGLSPVNNQQVKVPMAQVSIFSLYESPSRISGDRYNGVPHRVDLNSFGQQTDQPKSQIFGIP